MKYTFRKVTTLSVLGALMACAQTTKQPGLLSPGPVSGLNEQTARAQPRLALAPTAHGVPVLIANTTSVGADTPSSQALFLQGRAAHGLGHLVQAAEYYTQVLQLEPQHVAALNALAVIHAQEGRTQEAVALLTRAIALAPDTPHLYNNIGYALLRAGYLDEAGLQLKRAQELSPASLQLLQNMELLAQAKREATAEMAMASSQPGARLVAIAPQIYALQTIAPAQLVRPVEALASGVQSTSPAWQQAPIDNAVTKPHEDQRAAGTTPMAQTASVPAESSHDSLLGVQLEVANGVGIAHLAKRTADRLASSGVKTVRLTDAKPYRQTKTEIQFGPGQRDSAKALQERLPFTSITSAMPSQLRAGLQLRLVLGHDMKGQAVAAWLESQDAGVALNPPALPVKVASRAAAERS